MANIVKFAPGKRPLYLLSVNTPDYDQDPNCLVNPDISNVVSVPVQYWKRSGNDIVEMTPEEKLAVDTTEKEAYMNQVNIDIPDYVTMTDMIEVLLVLGNTQWSQNKTVTKTQFLDLLKQEIQKRNG